MKKHRSQRFWMYVAISFIGLFAVAYCFIRLVSSTDPADDVPALDALFGNWNSTLLIVDLLIASVAAIIWAVGEARRLKMRWVLWLVLMLTTPFAFTLPLFLAMRERRRDELEQPAAG